MGAKENNSESITRSGRVKNPSKVISKKELYFKLYQNMIAFTKNNCLTYSNTKNRKNINHKNFICFFIDFLQFENDIKFQNIKIDNIHDISIAFDNLSMNLQKKLNGSTDLTISKNININENKTINSSHSFNQALSDEFDCAHDRFKSILDYIEYKSCSIYGYTSDNGLSQKIKGVINFDVKFEYLMKFSFFSYYTILFLNEKIDHSVFDFINDTNPSFFELNKSSSYINSAFLNKIDEINSFFSLLSFDNNGFLTSESKDIVELNYLS